MGFRGYFSGCVSALALSGLAAGQSLPVVDLLTSVHRGQVVGNTTHGYYTFNNIPFAEPPVGPLRFRVPIPKITINRTVDDGTATPKICPQADAGWFGISIPFAIEQVTGSAPPPPTGPPPPDPRQNEDCLYLDVKSPRAVFENNRKNLPVLVWIHGGGFARGSKNGVDPTGLIAQGLRDGKTGFVYVGINYRVGLFGFPPRGPADWDVATNAGLYDQRLALLWVQANIHKFGGDASKVTVIGESAGASSIAAQLTSFWGIDGSVPFKRAIIQSPAIRPATDATVYAQVYTQFLAAAGVSSMNAARSLPYSTLQGVNLAIAGASSFGHFTWGPNVDGFFFPDQLVRSLALKRVDRNVDVIVTYTADEALIFTDPRVQDNTAFKAYFQGLLPSIPASKINTLATTVYPEDFSGAQPYTTQTQRLKLAVAEAIVLCNAFATDLAYQNTTRAAKFSVWPALHANDVAFTFYNGEPVDWLGIPIPGGIARQMQQWFVDYAISGTSSGSTANIIPVYTSQNKILNITDTGNTVAQPDPAANPRCRFWVEGLYA
ncbi:Alpha/Beta hydrolase protein [Immersiella caudata]|uniref:Carboxylic ester hydrolase n=1 Tax=Immersiella caudata TaxID=314043 RepID=A0AA39WAM9_9PEZI|nr:Alpha/Beta hydrolase protein [Immersiella caudata]